MNRRLIFDLALIGLVIVAFFVPDALAAHSQLGSPLAPQVAPTTAFTYQGELKKSGNPHTGTCNFQFRLFDAAVSGTQLGGTQTINNVVVTSGLFTVSLDFGSQFNGSQRFLETSVQCAGDGSFTPLSPLTPLSPAPYSISTSGLRGRTVSDANPATGDVLTWDGSQWAPDVQQSRRLFYLTPTQAYNGSQALTACAAGYHMASLPEILDLGELEYNTTLGATGDDSGYSLLTDELGWVRTGFPITTGSNIPGYGNCLTWTNGTAVNSGTLVRFESQWSSTTITPISPWEAGTDTCDIPHRVWCIQD